MAKFDGGKEEWSSVQHSLAYLNVADNLPHRTEGKSVLLDHVSRDASRVLDLGTGDGRLLRLLEIDRPKMNEAIALDISPTMLKAARDHFENDNTVKVVEHDLSFPLPDSLGYFDALVSSFAIHHLDHKRKRALYEVYNIPNPTGVFCNLEHVASPSVEQHVRFLNAIGYSPKSEDKSNKLLPMETQLGWLREIGFVDVDCY